jgi:hypothetical protein
MPAISNLSLNFATNSVSFVPLLAAKVHSTLGLASFIVN